MNHDGYPEFFVCSRDNSLIPDYINYATILTEHYVGIDDQTQPTPNSPVKCYPNPFQDKVNIKFLDKQPNTSYDISIFDIKGRRIFRQDNIRSDTFTWNVEENKDIHFSHGIYLLQITGNNKTIYTSKLVYSE